ncbi:MAG: hypothetical protein NT131_06215 [Methanomassiliicoccales archaeon]|nr:hypothetical protein [Methanomassiliicoccales archaeon]
MVKVITPKGEANKAPVKKEPRKMSEEAPLDPRAASLQMLSQFYLGAMDLDMKARQMAVTSGKEVLVWMAALELMRDLVIKTEDPDLKLKMYQGMVDLLAKMGQKDDLRTIQEIIARYNLKSFKDLGFERVEVECAKDACPTCRKMTGKRFKIEEAMSTMPLPCHDCSTEREAVKGYCRCRYFAIF